MTILIDTSVLLASAYNRDQYHQQARPFIQSIRGEKAIVIAPVLSELFFMVSTRVNYDQAALVFALTQVNYEIELMKMDDFQRMSMIMQRYRDNRFDYTDTALMAVSERLHITRIATFDRRDFGVYRPSHASHYELLP